MSDNQAMRDLFTLPPIVASNSTALMAPIMPIQRNITGDKEVDAVLWLQEVIKTGSQPLIEKALKAAKQIKTPMKELGDRYADHIRRNQPGNLFAVLFATMNFGDLERQAEAAVSKAALKHEALSRFGSEEALFKEHPAERQCRLALKGMKPGELGFIDDKEAKKGFDKRPALIPYTIDDCLHVIGFWSHFYALRGALCQSYYESTRESYAHENYAFFMLGEVPVSSEKEALAAFDHIQQDDKEGWAETASIYRHLISSGWAAKELSQ